MTTNKRFFLSCDISVHAARPASNNMLSMGLSLTESPVILD